VLHWDFYVKLWYLSITRPRREIYFLNLQRNDNYNAFNRPDSFDSTRTTWTLCYKLNDRCPIGVRYSIYFSHSSVSNWFNGF